MRLLRERIRTNMQCDRVSKIPKEMKRKNMPAVWPSLSPKSFVCGFPFVLWRLRELWVVVFDRFFVFSFFRRISKQDIHSVTEIPCIRAVGYIVGISVEPCSTCLIYSVTFSLAYPTVSFVLLIT